MEKLLNLLKRPLIRQIVLYGVIGGGSAMFDFLIFTLLYTNFGINEFITNIISVHAGIIMSFILNRRFNFKKTDRLLFRAASFYCTGLFGLALSQGILWLGGILSLSAILSKFISVFFVAAVQFIINKFITFNK